MAITYVVTRSLFEGKLLPNNASILEFGEANWMDELEPLELRADIARYIEDPDQRNVLDAALGKGMSKSNKM